MAGGFPKDKEIDFKVEAEDLKVYNTEIKLEDKDLDEEFYNTMSELETDEDLNEEFYDAEESQIGGSKLSKKSFCNQRKKSIRKKTVKKNSAISKDPDIKISQEKKKPKAKKASGFYIPIGSFDLAKVIFGILLAFSLFPGHCLFLLGLPSTSFLLLGLSDFSIVRGSFSSGDSYASIDSFLVSSIHK